MDTPLRDRADKLDIRVFPTRTAMGAAAAADCAAAIREVLARSARCRAVFAAAPSQNELLAGLCAAPGIDWNRVEAFHMDEYLGLDASAPQRFGSFLRERIFGRLPFGAIHYMLPAGSTSPVPTAAECAAEAARYGALLRIAPIDIVCLGVGENGHIAFNDPPVARFDDPELVKVVELDAACRQQQVNDGCFPTFDAVPRFALTATIPALTAGRRLFCVVPGPTKATAVGTMLRGPIATTCPASILRRHPACTLYLDADSARDWLSR